MSAHDVFMEYNLTGTLKDSKIGKPNHLKVFRSTETKGNKQGNYNKLRLSMTEGGGGRGVRFSLTFI